MAIKKAVVTRLKQICNQKNITLNALANLSGLTPSTVYSMMDVNRKDIGIVAIKKLCDGLDISIIEFFDTELFRTLEQELK